jgi:multidrug efflux pump subunit AcrA (membrane-fusion protein)
VVEGQEAEIKLDAFQYTKYGTIPGTVVWVSRDAVPDEKLGLLYPVRVALARTHVDVGPRKVNLGPGLSAEVEIKTEKRRVIEYLLSSLQRYRHESMRER